MLEGPRSLGTQEARRARRERLNLPRVLRLTELVNDIRREKRLVQEVPYFDPLDGGIEAECLFLLEAPGPRAVLSGFISRDNPDQTAENFSRFLDEVGIPREQTVIWNIVPWYPNGGTPTPGEVREALTYLERLLPLLGQLRAVVLVGGTAERARETLEQRARGVRIFECPHPSPVFVNRNPENPKRIAHALAEVAHFLRRV